MGNKQTRFLFVTGGVVSSLGKGVAAASLGAVLESRGLSVTILKLVSSSFSQSFRNIVGTVTEIFDRQTYIHTGAII